MDLIERQAAIEIIQSMYPGMPRVPWMRKDWQKRYEPYIRTENAIRKLPSVQQEQCEDAVSREAVLDKAYAYGNGLEPEGYCVNVEDIQALPSVTPKRMPPVQLERPKGKWIWELDEGDPNRSRMLVCSICGSGRNEVGTYNFCNICGAKMINPRGEQDE